MAYHESCRHTEDFVATPVLFIMKLDRAHTRNRGMGGRLDKVTHIIYLETGRGNHEGKVESPVQSLLRTEA